MMRSVRRRQAFLLEITFMCGTWTCKCHHRTSGLMVGIYERCSGIWRGEEDWVSYYLDGHSLAVRHFVTGACLRVNSRILTDIP